MQWSPDRNGGFSRADPQRLYFPPIMDPIYGYEAVNVEAQLREPGSLLNWTRRMLTVRKSSRAFGRGTLTFVRPGNRKILAYLREHGDDAILCVANLARTAQPVELDLRAYAGRVPVEMLGRTPFPPIGQLPYLLTLPGHHFYWFRLERDAPAPAWHVEMLAAEELPALVLFEGWASVEPERVAPWRRELAERARAGLGEALRAWIATQRWYAAKSQAATAARLATAVPWAEDGGEWLLAFVDVERAAGSPTRWFVPLSLAWEDGEGATVLKGAALARARRHARVGFVADALQDPRFVRAVVAAVAAGRTLEADGVRLRFQPTAAFAALAGDWQALPVRVLGADSSNTAVALGERLLFKAFRRVLPGVNPEVEVGAHLTDVVPFGHVARVAGAVYAETADGTAYTLGVLQEFVLNQGDGWRWALDYLERYLERCSAGSVTAPAPPLAPGGVVGAGAGVDAAPGGRSDAAAEHGGFLSMIAALGTRTAELHAALARATGRPDFDPEPVDAATVAGWAARVEVDLDATLERLEAARATDAPIATALDRVRAGRDALRARIRSAANVDPAGLVRTRHHGDYHLGQVLVAKNDFVIVDFEGEPARPVEERRGKHSPLRDVAGMLRSFDYVRHAARRAVDALQPAPCHAELADAWLAATTGAFLAAYRAAYRAATGAGGDAADAAAAGAVGDADVAARADPLLDLFVLEKALYEVRYELDNRPDWVIAPLAALARAAAGEDRHG